MKDLAALQAQCDVIVANRVSAELADVRQEVYIRDLFSRTRHAPESESRLSSAADALPPATCKSRAARSCQSDEAAYFGCNA